MFAPSRGRLQARGAAFKAVFILLHAVSSCFAARLARTQVLEIASAAGCGRTTALLQVAASCILPALFNGIDYGGQAGALLAGRELC